MAAEEFVIAFIKSEILMPRELKFSNSNSYAEEFRGIIDKKLKQGILKPQKKHKEKIKVPRFVQDIIPVKAIYEDGLFLVGKNKYSKSYKFLDINYAVASREDKEVMFLEYSKLLNSLDTGSTAKITINNRRINKLDFEKKILLKDAGDDLDKYRKEYNTMLDSQSKTANEIVQEKILTITMVITEETPEKLEILSDAIEQIAGKNMCQMGTLRYQQLDGLETVLPFGVRKINALRTLTTESLAVFIPFKVKEIRHENGVFYGQNTISKNIFTNGSLNTFALNTNVDTSNKLICYDILDLGKQLLPIGMLVVLNSILNRITANRTKGKNTYIFIDEIYLLFQYEYSANFLFTLWKRVRKYGAYATGITQNVEDLLQSHTARTMLANSEFIIMLNQAYIDRLELGKLLNISDEQMSFITNVGAGEGLMRVGSANVPFVNRFPKNTELYRLMTTKPGESINE